MDVFHKYGEMQFSRVQQSLREGRFRHFKTDERFFVAMGDQVDEMDETLLHCSLLLF